MGFFVKESIKVAAIQSLIVQGEKDKNLEGAFALLGKALEQKPRLVCLTQAFGSGINFIILQKMAEPIPDGRIAKLLSEKAKEKEIFIAAGILELGEDGKVYDAAVLFAPNGDLLGKYRRWVRWGGETNYISQGRPMDCIQTEIGKVGLILGYDLCFPQTCHRYFLQGVDMIICCGAIFEDLSYDAQLFCSARAMENHCYLVYAGAIGEHQFANMHYMGHSAITCDPYFMVKQLKEEVKPGMDVLAKAGKGEEFILANLFIDDLQKGRKKLPFQKDLERTLNDSNV